MSATRGAKPRPIWSQILDGPGGTKPPYQTLTNAVRVLEHDPLWNLERLHYDEFAGRIIFVNSPAREWRDDDDVALTVYMQDTTGMSKIQKHLVADAVDLVARRRGRHAVRDWLSSLAWDGVERIEHAFEDHWGATSQPSLYVRAASQNMFVGLVARVFSPGCKLDTMVVFEGPQGIFKSSALAILGGEWYAAIDESAASKDFLQVLRGKWLIELCELNSLSKTESQHVKGMLSRHIDTYRASYGRRPIDVPRQCQFAGTTNHDDWLVDETGGRRFWPIRCGLIDLVTLAAAREQLFAEAVVLFKSGATWWEMPSLALDEQAMRQQHDEWAAIVLPWADTQVTIYGATSVSVKDVLLGPLKFPSPDKLDKASQMRVAKILRISGWRRNQKLKTWEPPREGSPVGGTQNEAEFIT